MHVLLNPTRAGTRGSINRLLAQNYFVSRFPDDDSSQEWPLVKRREVWCHAQVFSASGDVAAAAHLVHTQGCQPCVSADVLWIVLR